MTSIESTATTDTTTTDATAVTDVLDRCSWVLARAEDGWKVAAYHNCAK